MKRFTFFLTLVMACVVQVGCSTSEAFKRAALPLAQNFATDVQKYDATNTAALSQVQTLVYGCESGNKTQVVQTWYGNGGTDAGFRAYYAAWLTTHYTTGDGLQVQGIKQRNVTTFDYILSVGTTPLAK